VTVFVQPPDGSAEIPMSGSEVDDLYAEVLRLRAEVALYKPIESTEVVSVVYGAPGKGRSS
jgi:hypothetical protein